MIEDIIILTICVPPVALFLWFSAEGLLWEDKNTKAMRKKRE